MSTVIGGQALRDLVNDWIGQGLQVAGPGLVKDELVLYRWLHRSDQLLLESYQRPRNSIKDFLFPRHEKLYGYHLDGRKVELTELPPPETPQIIFAARPCDAAALPILDHVFNWDFQDSFYNHRRKLTTVVTLACQEHDAECFCTAVGGGPADERGSDVMLFALGQDQYEVRCFTDKGKALFAEKGVRPHLPERPEGCCAQMGPDPFFRAGQLQESTRVGKAGPGPSHKVDLAKIREFVSGSFESPRWTAFTLRCVGCGACTYNCPTCHCFDITDEKVGSTGARVRSWDSCQLAMFTHHASGHNPRTAQPQRQRQRVAHKFDTYPAKFGEILCTGCGNCARVCPVGLGILPALAAIERDQAGSPSTPVCEKSTSK